MRDSSVRSRNDWPVGPANGPAVIVSGLTLLALFAAFANDLSLLVQLPIAFVVLASGARAVRGLLRPRIDGIRVDGQQVRVRSAGGARSTGEVIAPPFVSPLYVGLRWRQDGRRLPRSFGVFRGQMEETDFRRLCATLRQQGEA